MKHRLAIAFFAIFFALLIVYSKAVSGEPAWPESLDVDLAYRNSAVGNFADRNWALRLGAGIEREPTFQGSDASETELDALIIAAYRTDWGNLFLSGGGLGYSRMLTDSFGIQLQLEAEDTREESDDDRLRGLGDQDEELELEIVGRYFLGPWQLGGSVALATGDKGVVWFVGGGRTWRISNRGFLSMGADLSGSDRDNQQTDFGINPIQSAASGYPVYAPSGGLKSFGLNAALDFQLSSRWYLNMSVDYERLLGDIADSPLVTQGGSDNNWEAAIGVYFRF